MSERCISCGAEARRRFNPETGQELPAVHPFVAVMHLENAPEGAEVLHQATSEGGQAYGSFAVCEPCQRTPERHAGLKAHFFPRAQARLATNLAGSADVSG